MRRVWRCSHAPGELMWVPAGLEHATVNRGAETVALTTLLSDVTDGSLHEAARRGIVKDVDALLDTGIAVDARDRQGSMALHWAAGEGRADAIRALLAAGAELGAPDGR